jgi:type VI secretion system protein ImpF
LDDTPRKAVEGPHAALFDVAAFKAAVARDLEALLNTRCVDPEELIESYPEARESVVAYGIHDLSSLSLLNPDDRSILRDRIRVTIERFEPRLAKVKVALESPRDFDRMLRFRVDAVLQGHPSRPAITFDAWLQLSSNEYGFLERK